MHESLDPSETLVVRRNDLCPRSIPAPFQGARFVITTPSPEPGVKRRAFLGVLGGAVAWPLAARGADQRKNSANWSFVARSQTEEAVMYLGADLSCRQNATHSRDIDWLLNHPLGRPCP